MSQLGKSSRLQPGHSPVTLCPITQPIHRFAAAARIYAHLYDDELDSVAAALDRIGRQP